jgi:CheY-like chemotaxis protein
MSPVRLLVVENEQIVAKALARQLKRLGYVIIAIAQADRRHPDLVLRNVCLTGAVDGLKAAARICARWPSPPVYLTGHSRPIIIERVRTSDRCSLDV